MKNNKELQQREKDNMESRSELFVYEFNKAIEKEEFLNIIESVKMFTWFLESLAGKDYESEFFKVWFSAGGFCMLFKPTGILIKIFYEEKTLHDARNPDFHLEVAVNRKMYASDFSTFFMLLQLDLDGLLDYSDLIDLDTLSVCTKFAHEKYTIV